MSGGAITDVANQANAGQPSGAPFGGFANIAGAQPPTQASLPTAQQDFRPMQMLQAYQQGTPINQLNGMNPTYQRPAQYLPPSARPSLFASSTGAPGAK